MGLARFSLLVSPMGRVGFPNQARAPCSFRIRRDILRICEERLSLVAVKIVRWLIFGAIISLLPLAFTFGDLALRGRPHHLADVMGNGELLVVVWVLSASALGEMFGGKGGGRSCTS
jgi:hypothetical protein